MTHEVRPVYDDDERELRLVHPAVLPGRPCDAALVMAGAVETVPAQHVAKLFAFAVVFAAGLYAGALLFNGQSHPAPTVVYCPTPGSAQVALVPAECGPPEGAR